MPVQPALSPSRASDFLQCPLLYRFRVIDRLETPPSAAAARGTLVHAVLERIFDVPADERTPDAATSMLPDQWRALTEAEPQLASLASGAEAEAAWLADAEVLVRRWFGLEDPVRLEPSDRERYVETQVGDLLLRGYIDRVDTAPTGEVRIVDYKTGRSPSERFETSALFQLKFYGLVMWRTSGVVPQMLQLVYLGDGQVLRYQPDEADLLATERKVRAIWAAIEQVAESGDWQPNGSRRCGWCDFQDHCPEFGGTPPPLPADAHLRALDPSYRTEAGDG